MGDLVQQFLFRTSSDTYESIRAELNLKISKRYYEEIIRKFIADNFTQDTFFSAEQNTAINSFVSKSVDNLLHPQVDQRFSIAPQDYKTLTEALFHPIDLESKKEGLSKAYIRLLMSLEINTAEKEPLRPNPEQVWRVNLKNKTIAEAPIGTRNQKVSIQRSKTEISILQLLHDNVDRDHFFAYIDSMISINSGKTEPDSAISLELDYAYSVLATALEAYEVSVHDLTHKLLEMTNDYTGLMLQHGKKILDELNLYLNKEKTFIYSNPSVEYLDDSTDLV